MRARCWVVAVPLVLGLTGVGPVRADVHLVPNPNGALRGRTVVFSPGHGTKRTSRGWQFQRGIVHDLREDIHTNEIFIEYVQRYLLNAGARVESCRERSFQTHEVIVDAGASGYSETGNWSESSHKTSFYGSSYRHTRVASSETAWAEFRPTIPEAGRYPVYVWFTTDSNRSTAARYTVHHSGGRTELTVNQQDLGDSWIFLGEFHFEAGSAGRVVLSNVGSDPSKVVIADAVRFGGGVGRSGLPRWQEAAKEFLPYKGFSSSAGDVTIRSRYATWLAGGDTSRWRDDFLYFALHSNASGGGGGARGLSTFAYANGRTASWGSGGPAHYPTRPSSLQTESDRLRDAVHAAVLASVQAQHEPSWPNRRTHKMNFGELREARNMPSALIELGFHDNVDDTGLQRDARFRATAARAIYKGILRYWVPGAAVVPLPPSHLRLVNLGGGRVRVSWEPVLDSLEPSAAPMSFKVYSSRNGRGFDDGVAVTGTEHVIGGLTAGERVFVRIAAVNDGGESLPSGVGGALVGEPGAGAWLIVDGFDRAYRHTQANIAGRYTADYGVEHLDALASAGGAAAIDFAANEAVIGGQVSLDGYLLVDWLLGRESSTDSTFDRDEQALVEAFLAGGGALLVSGTEIAWDLEERRGGQRFLNEVLGVGYVRDDARVHAVEPAASGPLAGVGRLRLGDGGNGSYDAASPDVIEPRGGARAVLTYAAAGAPVAAVLSTTPRKVAVLGFPLESVVDTAQRTELTRRLVGLLLPGGAGSGSSSGSSSGSGSGSGSGSSGGKGTTSGGSTAAGSTPVGGSSFLPRRRSGSSCRLGVPGAATPDPLGLLPLGLLLLLLLVGRAGAGFAPAHAA